jgi:hypothetical protein
MGIEGFVHVAMNRVRVKAPEEVHGILRQFDIRPTIDLVEVSDGETGTLVLQWESIFDNPWPSAVRMAELPPDDACPDDDDAAEAAFDAYFELHDAKGDQGVIELLLKLAPFLAGPLTLQAAEFSSDGWFGGAQEWTIRPDATAVECHEINGFDNGADLSAPTATTVGLQQEKPSFADAAYALTSMLNQRYRETIH